MLPSGHHSAALLPLPAWPSTADFLPESCHGAREARGHNPNLGLPGAGLLVVFCYGSEMATWLRGDKQKFLEHHPLLSSV